MKSKRSRFIRILIILMGSFVSLFVIYVIILFVAWGNISETEVIFSSVIDNKEYSIVASYGGAVSADYLLLKSEDSLIQLWKVSMPVELEDFTIADSIKIVFAEPVYFLDSSKNLKFISIPYED